MTRVYTKLSKSIFVGDDMDLVVLRSGMVCVGGGDRGVREDVGKFVIPTFFYSRSVLLILNASKIRPLSSSKGVKLERARTELPCR